MIITMIKITHLQTKKAEVSWETGNDFVFLQNLKHLIEIRNKLSVGDILEVEK